MTELSRYKGIVLTICILLIIITLATWQPSSSSVADPHGLTLKQLWNQLQVFRSQLQDLQSQLQELRSRHQELLAGVFLE
ncbi:hypothetical protein POX_d05690 [Penicillium oxalicum]|uniref:hypothetical protein n=1 Tax=Penicillium oxalicum TaxID=69781 RepID=UPI0020B82F8C|nr:hypothetical protein POX_d05690 [Penicillium oxalicum]KAI2790184.1 hypothetical protein POX_d05690 [Penicillium oxalicum]